MDIFTALHMDVKTWNRKVLNAYWFILLIIGAAQIWGYYIIPSENSLTQELYIKNNIESDIFLVTVMVGVELTYRYMKSKFEYILILLGVFIANILFIFNKDTDIGVQVIFILPILMSIYYFNTKKIVFAGMVTILNCFVIFPIFIQGTKIMIVNEIITTTVTVLITCLFAFFIKIRGLGLIANLQATTKNQQDLVIQNILMDKMIKVDALTGLNNHKTYHEYIEKLIEQAEGNELKLQLALLDIDNFKSVNDTFGHRVGDLVLKEVAKQMEDSITSEDISFRYGGEEFAIIFTNKTIYESYHIVNKIRNSISLVNFQEMPGRHVTISAGLSEYNKGKGKDLFFNKSDSNLYKAKRDGKNKIFSEGFDENR